MNSLMIARGQNELSTIEAVIADAKAGKLFILSMMKTVKMKVIYALWLNAQALMLLILWQNMGGA